MAWFGVAGFGQGCISHVMCIKGAFFFLSGLRLEDRVAKGNGADRRIPTAGNLMTAIHGWRRQRLYLRQVQESNSSTGKVLLAVLKKFAVLASFGKQKTF